MGTLDQLTGPPGGMCLFSISQSIAFLEAYCFAAFLLEKVTSAPNSICVSAIKTL